ncbi:DUF559 domain-containing protein [bacterium]|nr:DUF559 domain-containing protein [bacterium]
MNITGKHPFLQSKARLLRKNQTTAEKMLWNRLRNKQLSNLKFRRQHLILGKIVDFFCYELKLIIEVDGNIHDEINISDSRRDKLFQSQGFQILRIQNEDIYTDIQTVLKKIKTYAQN